MAGEELVRGLLSEQAYDLIRASILDGTRPPGSRLVESEIARGLSVSQAPVREAMKRLVHEGLVTSRPRAGSYVTEITPEEYSIAREMRAALERVGARSAVKSVTDADVRALRSHVTQMRTAVGSGDWATFRTIDIAFHRSALAIGGHTVLNRLWSTLEPLLLSQRVIGDPGFPGDKRKLVSWHTELIVALTSGDADLAGEAFYKHAAGELDASHKHVRH